MMRYFSLIMLTSVALLAAAMPGSSQEKPPAASAPKTVNVPAVTEKKLPNALTIAVAQRHDVPLVTIALVFPVGAYAESEDKAGLADITADMLTKGTRTRSATEIAEAIEFLGGSINSGAGWNSTSISITVTSDKVPQAMAILADVVLNPRFDDKELDLLKSQMLDELTYNLKQPSYLANFVASKYSFREHPVDGTPESIKSITIADVRDFYANYSRPHSGILIFTGDITVPAATTLARRSFGAWPTGSIPRAIGTGMSMSDMIESSATPSRILVVDLPKSGQAAVTYARTLHDIGRTGPKYYTAAVLNSVLGGGYSSRLNYEIRIKRGLSYGAGSGFGWRARTSDFVTRVQTKNPSAPEVAELTLDEIRKLGKGDVESDELVPRKSVLTGGFDRNLETTTGLAGAIGELYAFGISPSELNKYVADVDSVEGNDIKGFASVQLGGGDLIIVGDYSIFKDDLAKRFPDTRINVIEADNLDLSKPSLQK